ncbi:MAG TPA: DMT family transporter [Candidatus Limnocylindria bacterium]
MNKGGHEREAGNGAAPRRDLVGASLVLAAASFFATLGPLAAFAAREGVSSLALVTWRAGLGALCVPLALGTWRALGHSVSITRLRTLPARDRWSMAGAAIANTILNLSVFVAFTRIGITLSLLIFYLYPAFVAVASVAWFGDKLDRLRWSALAMSMVGIVLVVAGAGQVGAVDALGIGLALLGALGQTFYVMAARHGFARVPGAQAAFLTMAGAAGIYVVLAILFAQAGTLLQPLDSAAAFWPVLLAGVIGAGAPTFLYITGIRRLGAPRAAILSTFEPVVGVALATMLLGERPGPLQLVGGALIVAAAITLQLRPHAELAEHEAYAETDTALSS